MPLLVKEFSSVINKRLIVGNGIIYIGLDSGDVSSIKAELVGL